MTFKTNESVSEHLRQIARIYEVRRETQRSIAFNRAADAILNYDQDITTLTDLCEIPNIGPSSAEVISQYLEKGSSQRFDDLNATTTNTVEFKLDLESFAEVGISALTALSLWNKHKIGNVDQLKNAIKSGSYENSEIAAKLGYISRSEIEDSVKDILRILDDIASYGLSSAAGSYRRERPYVKDLDFVVVANPQEVYDVLNSNGYNVLYGGDQKIRIKLDKLEADILVTTKSEWATALLYLTGSFEFNIKVRGRAKALGFTLNEHGLFDGDTKLDTPTEESILIKLLGQYIEPKSRI